MNRKISSRIAIAGVVAISAAIVIGPFFAPPEFSVLRHSTSEQAGQQLAAAWIMRAGFVSYGLATISASLTDWATRSYVRAALLLFGLGLIGTAIWSNASILAGTASDMNDDWLHSIASGIVGTAFATACAARIFAPGGQRHDALAWAGLVMAVLFPPGMQIFPDYRGLIQRSMFVMSFIFVVREFRGGESGKAQPPEKRV